MKELDYCNFVTISNCNHIKFSNKRKTIIPYCKYKIQFQLPHWRRPIIVYTNNIRTSIFYLLMEQLCLLRKGINTGISLNTIKLLFKQFKSV